MPSQNCTSVRVLFAVLLVAFASGCASQNARIVALETLKATSQYEKELDRKIAAEKEFYRTQAETLNSLLAGAPLKVEPGEKISNDSVKKTWLYGYIATSTQYEARRTAGDFLSRNSSEKLIAVTMDFVERGVQETHAAIAEVRAKQKDLALRVAANLAPIEKQKQRLKVLRKGLTSLAADPSDTSKLKHLGSIAAVILEEAQK